MSLKSMTGFGRCDGRHGSYSWHWEVRTVNGRGLDIRLRLPPGFEALEQTVREACKQYFTRGSCALSLVAQRDAGVTHARLNEEMFNQVTRAAEQAQKLSNATPATLDGLLSLRGVIEYAESDEDETEVQAREDAVIADLKSSLEAVVAAREKEGASLEQAISEQIDEIETLVATIAKAPSRLPEAIGVRLKEQVDRIAQLSELDEQRLYQEAVLLAAKADVEEELSRLKSHVEAARDLLKKNEPVGRQLDFLTQEFNREANTICSKSSGNDVTQAGLALKAVIDRMREQVQNIE